MSTHETSLAGRRVLITGAARGIGAALAERLHQRGARVALAGLEPELLAEAAAKACAPWWHCDVGDRAGVEAAVDIALLGRYYERIADHAVSVANRVVFVVTGENPSSVSQPS